MSIGVSKISAAQSELILRFHEGHFLDFKAIEIKPAKLSETISAFANADGGELFIGISETNGRRNWRGFTDPEAANGHIQCFEQMFPLGQEFEYGFLEADNSPGLVLHVQVRKTKDIKSATDGSIYLRRGAGKIKLTSPDQIKHLEYAKGISSFETTTVVCDATLVTNSAQVIEFMLQVVPTAEPDAWLRKQQLLSEAKPTVSALLLFADEPQAVLPKRCGIKVYRYKTKAPDGARETLAFTPITIEGPAYTQIRSAVANTVAVIEEIKKLGEAGLEDISYPQVALHEIITNAVLHRDYSIADDIHIRVFDNRIEVESPGRLPAHITTTNILSERFARNGNLVRIINKFPDPPNKDVGEGLNTAFQAMKKLGLKEPVIIERENSVLVSIRHEGLASPEEVIIEYLREHETIKNKRVRELCNIDGDYVVKELFNRLAERKIIERVPGTKTSSTSYRRGSKFPIGAKKN